MLIHRATMGVLDTYWTGAYRTVPGSLIREPVYREYSFTAAPELNPSEWWELPRSSRLGRKVRLYYPWITPVVDEAGALTDVEIHRESPDGQREAQKAVLQQEAARRGYRTAGRVRPKNIMPFLAGGANL